MSMNFKKLAISLLIGQIVLLSSGSLVIAKADDLIIKDNGQIVLILTTDEDVLGDSKEAPSSDTVSTTPNPAPTTVSSPTKIVPVVPAHTESTVQISSSTTSDKKVQVTITKGTPAPAPQKNQTAGTTATTKPVVTTQPASTVIKTVDRVVEQGKNGQPVVSIKSDNANEITLQQGTTKISTSLPIQINSSSHVISVVTPDGNSTKLSVLPTEAVQEPSQQGFITNSLDTKSTITEDKGQIVYNISGNKTGKLFGVFPVNSPVNIHISAETGKILNVFQSPLLSLFGFLVR